MYNPIQEYKSFCGEPVMEDIKVHLKDSNLRQMCQKLCKKHPKILEEC